MYETYLFDLNFFIIVLVCVCVHDGRMCHHRRKIEYYTHVWSWYIIHELGICPAVVVTVLIYKSMFIQQT